jgi:hypothetical protein
LVRKRLLVATAVEQLVAEHVEFWRGRNLAKLLVGWARDGRRRVGLVDDRLRRRWHFVGRPLRRLLHRRRIVQQARQRLLLLLWLGLRLRYFGGYRISDRLRGLLLLRLLLRLFWRGLTGWLLGLTRHRRVFVWHRLQIPLLRAAAATTTSKAARDATAQKSSEKS